MVIIYLLLLLVHYEQVLKIRKGNQVYWETRRKEKRRCRAFNSNIIRCGIVYCTIFPVDYRLCLLDVFWWGGGIKVSTSYLISGLLIALCIYLPRDPMNVVSCSEEVDLISWGLDGVIIHCNVFNRCLLLCTLLTYRGRVLCVCEIRQEATGN